MEADNNKKILFIYPDRLFNEFMKNYLEIKGYTVKISVDSVEGIRLAINYLPDLIILNKEFPSLDAMGFVIKKRTLHAIASTPMFLIGDFAPEELLEFKQEKVMAFLSSPLNPTALVGRLNIFFDTPDVDDKSRTPMLMDIHIKSNIINIQIEGNFEPVKLELLNYLLRSFCIQKKIKTPKILIMVPSLYPESITMDNLERLFKFMTYHEIKVDFRGVKILAKIDKLITMLQKHPEYRNIEVIDNFADAILSLQINFDKQKNIPVDFLKPGATYIFDLYDENGRKMIPAMTKLTEATIAKIKSQKISRLTYYSDKEVTGQEIEEDQDTAPAMLEEDILAELITEEFEPIEAEIESLKILDQKQSLFFRKMKGQAILIISKEESSIQVIYNTLDIYFDIEYVNTGKEILDLLSQKRYAIIFLDSEMNDPDSVTILQSIRHESTRRKTSVIILTKKIDKVSVLRYRNAGTQNILLSPVTTSKLEAAVFNAVTVDRRT